jgi:hypothetical protein
MGDMMGIIPPPQATSPSSPFMNRTLSWQCSWHVPPPPPPIQEHQGEISSQDQGLANSTGKSPHAFQGVASNTSILLGHHYYFIRSAQCTCCWGKINCHPHLHQKIIFKGHITADSNLQTKFLYAMEICIQHCLRNCQKFGDCSMVKDRLVLICFSKVFKMAMYSSLNIILPPSFIKPPPKNPMNATKVMPGDDGKQKGEKKRKSDKVEGEHIVKNSAPITKFLMKEGKIWRPDFAGKCTWDCPKRDETTSTCACWHICVPNASSTATTRLVTWGCAPFPKQSTMNSWPTLKKFAGRTPPRLRPDFPGRDAAMPVPKKSHPTNPPTPTNG